MPEKTPERSLHRKLAQVMYEAERIPKRGKAPKEMGGYPFVQVGDAADFIRKALAEQVITMMPIRVQVTGQQDRPTKSGGSMTTVDLITTWRLTDGESGEYIDIESFGAGADGGDKYSGKASTSAMKYALLTGFLLSTGEDSELGGHPDARPTNENVSPLRDNRPVEQRTTHHDGLIGKAIAQGTQDFQLRQGPDGPVLPFRIKEGRLSQIAVARGPIAVALDTYRDEVLNQRCTVWGHYTDESYTKKDKDGEPYDVTYKVLHVERIKTPAFEIPSENGAMPDPSYGEQDVMESDALEAESLPVWEPLDEEERALVAGNLP